MMKSLHDRVREMSDQEVTDRYTQETLKLKTLLQAERPGDPFLGYPNTAMMNCCKRELEHRGLPIPHVLPPGGEKPLRFPVTKAINKLVLDHHKGLNGGVFCEIGREDGKKPWIYPVLGARSPRGILSVKTCNGWEFPQRVVVRTTGETEEEHLLWEPS
jgi:hypothetical protein